MRLKLNGPCAKGTCTQCGTFRTRKVASRLGTHAISLNITTRTSPRPAAKILFRGCDIKVSSSRSNSILPFSAGLISPPSLVNLLSARAILNSKHSTSRYIVLKIIIQSDSICSPSSVMDISHCFNFKIVNLVCRTLRRSAILSLQREFGSSCVCYRRKLGSTTK
jgi:hypothetical protein